MRRGQAQIEFSASCEHVFALVHDYERRLEWDSMLSQAYLLDGAVAAGLGVSSRCVGTWRGGFLALDTIYIRFEQGRLAAVRLANRPPFFAAFAASMRHRSLANGRSELIYTYSFRARPALLAPLLEPIMAYLLQREICTRLESLRHYLEN